MEFLPLYLFLYKSEGVMQVTTVSDFRNNIKEFMDAAWDNEEEIIVGRPKGKNVVIISFEAFEKMRKALEVPAAKPLKQFREEPLQILANK